MKKLFKPIVFVSAMSMVIACGGNSNNTKSTAIDHSTHDHSTPTEVPSASESPALSTGGVVIESNDQMQFNKQEITVKAGEQITITLKHVGKMGKEVMGHNIVILKPGTDIAAFGLEANKAKDSDYIPTSMASAIIAHSDVIGGGEESSFNVTLEAGKYDYICSFPGHLAIMKGVIIAE